MTENIDFRPLPPLAELMADGGRLLVTMVLREMPYAEYLKTVHWRNIRQRTFRIHGRRCTLGVECSGPLDVHHVTYDNRGDEKPEDTEVLCRKHHEMKHRTYRQFVAAQLAQEFRP